MNLRGNSARCINIFLAHVCEYERGGGGGLKNVSRFVMCIPVDNMAIIQSDTYIRHLTEYYKTSGVFIISGNTFCFNE